MAASLCRRVLLNRKFDIFRPQCRTGYIVLLPESPEDLPDNNPLLRNESLPHFSSLTTENCEAALAKHTQMFETGLWQLETLLQSKLDDNNIGNVFDEVIEPLERLGVPMENAWGLVKTLYLADQNVMPAQRYMNIHDHARRARSNKFNSLSIYRACKAGLQNENMTDEQRRVLNKFVLEGKLNGLDVEEKEKSNLIEVLTDLGKKRASYKGKLSSSLNSFKHTITDAALVRDFPPALLKRLAIDPEQPTRGPWTISLHPEILQPVLEHCPDGTLRRNLWLSNVQLCDRYSPSNLSTSVDLEQIRQKRQEQAKVLGFPTYLHMSMETKMAETVENVQNMLMNLLEKARIAQEREIRDLENFALARGFEGNVEMWDIPYWKRKQIKSLYTFDEEQLRDYFPLSQVLLGLFTLCEQLFDIKIDERKGADVWHPDVRFFRVLDEKTQENLGGFYLDPYARPGKVHVQQDPGWMVGLRNRSEVSASEPLASLIFNFQEPLYGKHSLLTFREVRLLFRRFGHALQHVLTKTRYSEVSGLSNVEWDAVDICSRFLELWVWERGTLESVSSHHETGEPLPNDLLENLGKLQRHMAGYELCREIYLSNLDLELHRTSEFWLQVINRLWPSHFIFPLDRKDSHPLSFREIVSEEWGAAYYCHLWAKVVAADAFSAFVEAGLDNHQELSAVGTRFRSTFLSLGGSCNPGEIFERFRGRGPSSEPLIRILGLAQIAEASNPETAPVLTTNEYLECGFQCGTIRRTIKYVAVLETPNIRFIRYRNPGEVDYRYDTMAVRFVKNAFSKHPIISNAVVYGSLYVGAEFSQQILTKKVLVEKGKTQELDKASLGRFLIVGSCINSNILYAWYKWLDGRYVGTASKIIAKKLVLDQFLMTPPLYVLFYVTMSFMEGKKDLLAECREKFIPTFTTSCAFWIPAQTLNFMYIPPAARVVFLGACSFAWVNMLCYIKRLGPKTSTEDITIVSDQEKRL